MREPFQAVRWIPSSSLFLSYATWTFHPLATPTSHTHAPSGIYQSLQCLLCSDTTMVYYWSV
ncbi:hypothetical protein BGLCM_0978 [Bifidobacterium gallicum DSM 20093 = LMG 11596]|uniref:Uncharacterized protein n=1 Tax=Bifidobacterium gallicum DSM 20093 = LMG 11596 TaxID=561180 RepID=A0A087AIT5_9BIFI|nr:hypothetical protein BGLCM_0978 [Bifidobacterium gallicum DSM 20093 = LMG 11596]